MLTEVFKSTAQGMYHNHVVYPFRSGDNHSKLGFLSWKQELGPGLNVLSCNPKSPGVENSTLSLSEKARVVWLEFILRIRHCCGDEPFGIYPGFHLNPEGRGTLEDPYSLAVGSDEFDALPGLIVLAAQEADGVYFTRGRGEVLHLDRNFRLSSVADNVFSESIIRQLEEEILKHTQLMVRRAESGFSDTIDWYDHAAEEYARSIENIVSWNQIKAFVSLLEPGANILDVGCGGGRDCRVFSDMGFNVTGIDLSKGLVSVARAKNPEINFIYGNYLESGLAAGSFQGLWVHASIHHLETSQQLKRAFLEFNRLLEIDGIIHIATQAQTGKEKTAIVFDTLSKHSRFYRYLTPTSLRRLLRQTGFEVLRLEQHKETDDNVNAGRQGVEWLVGIARKRL